MPRTHVDANLILSPTRIELAVPSSADGIRSMMIEQGVWRDALASGFRPFDQWLAKSAAELNLPKNPRVMIYVSGTGFRTEITQNASPQRAVQGIAHVTMAEQFEHEDGLYQVTVSRLEGRPDASTKAVRYFISAELDSTLDRLVTFVERAGMRGEGVSTLALTHAVVVSRTVSARPCLVCDLGEHESIVALGEDDAVPLFRPFNVGVASLVDVYTRVLEQTGVEDPHLKSRDHVFRFGVPGRNDVLDDSIGLTGRDVLPILQPVLQRLAVEIKNTIRFGLEGRDTDSLRVELTGPASAIPGLARVLSSLLDTEITAPGNTDAAETTAPTLAQCVEAAGGVDNPLRPFRLIHQNEQSRLKKLIRVGALAAVVALGVEALITYGQIRGTSAELDALAPRLTEVRAFSDQSAEAVTLADELEAVRAAIDERIGDVVPWAAALNTIASSIADNTKLTDCRGFRESGAAWYRLGGEVELASPEDRTLGTLLDTLEKSDLIDRVVLESARIENRQEGAVQRFLVRLRLVTRPAAPEAVLLADQSTPSAAGDGGTP